MSEPKYDKDAPVPFYQYRIAELESENKALREAAREAVDAVRFQKPEHERAAIDALAALLEGE